MKEFAKMPSRWIMNPDEHNGGLNQFNLKDGEMSNNISALMIYIVIIHNVNCTHTQQFYDDLGYAKMSYDELEEITGLSRKKISDGLKRLQEVSLIVVDKTKKASIYKLVDNNFDQGWGKLPFKYLYSKSQIRFFHEYNLRKRAELDSLKLYLLLIAFRNNQNNHTTISYQKIVSYTGINKNNIRTAISLLVSNDLIQVDQLSNSNSVMDQELDPLRTLNCYRLRGLSGQHTGNLNKEQLKEQLYNN